MSNSQLGEHKYIGEGSYGVVVYHPEHPTIAIKLFDDADTFRYEQVGYERAQELIKTKIPEYADYFVRFLGEEEQTFNEEMYHRTLHFEKYDDTLFNLFRKKSDDTTTIRMVLIEYVKMFKLFQAMIDNKIAHFDINPSNILYRVDAQKSEVKIAICDYSSLDYTHNYDYTHIHGYYFAYTPALYWFVCIRNDSVEDFRRNRYDISHYSSVVSDKMRRKLEDVDKSLNTFHTIIDEFKYGKYLMYEKYFCDVRKNEKLDIKRHSAHFKNQILLHYDGFAPTLDDFVADIVRYNDLYGYAIGLILLFKLMNRLSGEIEGIIFDMMTTSNYFKKDIKGYSYKIEELVDKLSNEDNTSQIDDLPKNSCIVM